MPLRRNRAVTRPARRHRRPAPMRLLDLPLERHDRRLHSPVRPERHQGPGCADALPIRQWNRETLFLFEVRHPHPPPAPFKPATIRLQRRLPRRRQSLRYWPCSRQRRRKPSGGSAFCARLNRVFSSRRLLPRLMASPQPPCGRVCLVLEEQKNRHILVAAEARGVSRARLLGTATPNQFSFLKHASTRHVGRRHSRTPPTHRIRYTSESGDDGPNAARAWSVAGHP